MTILHWGDEDWSTFKINAYFTPKSNLCYALEIRKGVKEFCISKEEALLIAKMLLPGVTLKMNNDKKNIHSFKGEGTLRNEAKKVDIRYTRAFTYYWNGDVANLAVESRGLNKQKVNEIRELREGQ